MRQFDCLLIEDPPLDGAWNMALDEGLLEAAAHDGVCALRFYGWANPTLSLGYFQHHQDRQAHQPSAACRLVRRSSGGGAILHDRELTYCIALAPSHPLARQPELLYRAAHESLVAALLEWGVKSALYQTPELTPPARPAKEPFLCFQRRVDGDVTLDEYKIAGSAQRRRHGAVLQHGSILLAHSKFAPELCGINDLNACALTFDALREGWLPHLGRKLEAIFRHGRPTDRAAKHAAEIADTRYGSTEWTLRR